MWFIALLIALLISWDFAAQVKHHPVVFYGLGAVVSAVLVGGTWAGLSGGPWGVFCALFGTGLVPFFLFVVVMFTGTFRVGSPARIKLKQVRQPVALLACVLTVGHILAIIVSPEQQMSDYPMLFVGANVVLAVLLVLLGATSVLRVVDVMPFNVWQAIHKSAYVFFVLLCLHSAYGNPGLAWMYLLVCVLYVGLRLKAAFIKPKPQPGPRGGRPKR